MEPDYPPAHYYLAETLRDMGQMKRQPQFFKRAADEYNIAIRRFPSHPKRAEAEELLSIQKSK